VRKQSRFRWRRELAYQVGDGEEAEPLPVGVVCRRCRGADRPGHRASARCGPSRRVGRRRVRIRPARWASTKRQPQWRLGFRGGEGEREREGRNEGERFREGDLSGAGVARLAGGPSNEIRAGEIKK